MSLCDAEMDTNLRNLVVERLAKGMQDGSCSFPTSGGRLVLANFSSKIFADDSVFAEPLIHVVVAPLALDDGDQGDPPRRWRVGENQVVPVRKAAGVGIRCDPEADLARNWCMGWPRHVVKEAMSLARKLKVGIAGFPERRSVYTYASAQVHIVRGSQVNRVQGAQVPPVRDSCVL
jgi:hypothetical protein